MDRAAQARSEDTQATADPGRVTALLEGLVRASRLLIESTDLDDRLRDWLAAVATAVSADAAFLGRMSEDGSQSARVLASWNRDGRPTTPAASLDIPSSDDFRAWIVRLERGETVWAQYGDLQDPRSREFWDSVGCETNMIIPIVRAHRTIAWLSIDWARTREHDPAVASVLQAAADGVAAAILRNEMLTALTEEREQRRGIEREFLAREQARARELSAANESLRRVARSLTPGATLTDFLSTVLRELASVCGSSVGGMFLHDDRDGSLRLAVSCTAGEGCVVAEPADDAPWFQPLPTDLTVRWLHRLREEQLVSMDRDEAIRTMASPLAMPWGHCAALGFEIDIPLIAGDRLVGVLTQLFPTRERATGFDVVHARAVAHMAALAIHQDRTARAMQEALLDAERRRVDRERSAELLRANRLLRATTRALAEATDETQMFSGCLAAILEQADAESVWLFRNEKDDGIMQLVGSFHGGRFSPVGEDDDPAHFRQGFDIFGHQSRRRLVPDQLIWRSLRDGVNTDAYPQATLDWHRRKEHAANAVQVLCIGSRVVGFLGMVFREHVQPSPLQRQHIHSLTHLVALTLELKRQGLAARQHAEQTAVLAERTRLAREIHDNIAQSFVAIQMQLKQLSPELRSAANLDEVIELAMHGLTQARRAVAALRPHELMQQALPDGIERLVRQLTMGTGLATTVERPAGWVALPTEVEDHLFRIVQEAVANVVKHAAAHHLRVELSQTPDTTSVLVSDDGVGFDPAARQETGYGMESIRQRAALIGGQAAWLSESGKGTQMLVSWGA